MRTRAIVVVGLVVLCLGMTDATSAAARKGSVMLLHGLPGFTADIYLDGKLLIDGFEPTAAAGPLRVAPGAYHVDIREVGAAADSDPVLSGTLRVAAGSSLSAVAHLDRSGDPALSVFDNAFAPLPAGRSLLRIRNVAQAPALTIRLDDRVVKRGLRLGNDWGIVTRPGRHVIAVSSSTSPEPLIPGSRVRTDEGAATIVYVIGSQEADNLDLMVQTVQGIGSAPSGVLTGIGDAGSASMPPWAVVVVAAAAATLLLSGRRRSESRNVDP